MALSQLQVAERAERVRVLLVLLLVVLLRLLLLGLALVVHGAQAFCHRTSVGIRVSSGVPVGATHGFPVSVKPC